MKTAVFVLGSVVAACVGGIAVQSASATVLDVTMGLNPVGYWNFESSVVGEPRETTVPDDSGNGNDLTKGSDAGIAPGGPAAAGSINAGEFPFSVWDHFHVDTPPGNVLNLTGNTLSINTWVNMGDTAADHPHRTRGVITKAHSGSGNAGDPWTAVPTSWDYGLWLELVLPPDYPANPPLHFRLNSYLSDGFGVDPATDIYLTPDDLTIGEWHMLTVSADAGMATMYYDGQPINPGGSPIAGAAIGGSSVDPYYSRLLIGGNPPTGPNNLFQSQIDEISIYDYALSAGQVSCLYTGGPCDPDPFDADFDEDGDVDGDDFLLWQTGFPTASDASKMDGDADKDGDVDGDDFLIWQAEFPSPGSGAGSGAVPEPTCLALLVLLGLGAAVRRMNNG